MAIKESPIILGALEQISLPDLGIENVLAKIDTGAYSGALHCAYIERIQVNKVPTIRFKILYPHAPVIETSKYAKTYVRSSTGHRMVRYIIDTTIDLRGKQYTIRIGLAKRDEMQTEVLIGRRFLRANGMLVDVRVNQELDKDGGGKL